MRRNPAAIAAAAAAAAAPLLLLPTAALTIARPAHAQSAAPPSPAAASPAGAAGAAKASPAPADTAASAGKTAAGTAAGAAKTDAAAGAAAKAGGAPAAKGSPKAAASASPAAAAAPTPQVIVIQQPAAAPPPANNWGSGLIGLAILAAALFFGLRFAQQRGVTVADSLRKMGVEMPQDGAAASGASVAHLKPAPPAVSPLPPLPSLADLPTPAETAAAVGAPLGGGGVAAGQPSFAAVPASGAGAAATAGPRLVGVSGPVAGQAFALSPAAAFTVGREEDNALSLPTDGIVSRRHARVEAAAGAGAGFAVVDEGSSNGTFVNGQRLPAGEPRPLASGDEIQIGGARLRYEAGA